MRACVVKISVCLAVQFHLCCMRVCVPRVFVSVHRLCVAGSRSLANHGRRSVCSSKTTFPVSSVPHPDVAASHSLFRGNDRLQPVRTMSDTLDKRARTDGLVIAVVAPPDGVVVKVRHILCASCEDCMRIMQRFS